MSKYIDAEVMINALRELRTKHLIQSVFGEDMRDNAVTAGTLEAVAQILDGFPAADVQEVKHGRWEPHELINRKKGSTSRVPWGYNCTFCGEWFVVGDEPIKRYHYCPNCGAKMDEEERNEN